MGKFLRSNKLGMTMVEILIVASLIGAVGVSIYGALSMGLKVWQRGRGSVVEQDIAIFFEKLTHDLRNAVYFSSLPAEGTGEKLMFPIVLPKTIALQNGEEETAEQVGLVQYEFEVFSHQLLRREAGYGKALHKTFSRSQILLESIEDIDFRYIYISDGQQLETDHLLETLPASIEVTVNFEDIYGRHEMKKTMDLPLSL